MAKKPSKPKAKNTGDAVPMPVSPRSDRNVCIRKIANGYVLRESGSRGGQYFERETFTRTQPKIVVSGTKD